MSWRRRIFITVAFVVALLSVPVFVLFIYDFYENAQNEKFYQARPMLQKMRAADQLPYPLADQKRRSWLLERVPNGLERSEAQGRLSTEGFACERPTPATQQNLLVCIARSTRVRWMVELAFDANDHLSDGRVLTLKP